MGTTILEYQWQAKIYDSCGLLCWKFTAGAEADSATRRSKIRSAWG